MSLYFFHLRDGVDIILDDEGRELDGAEAISLACLYEARAIIADDARTGLIMLDQRIDVQDSTGLVVHTLPFVDAVEIIQPQGENLSTSLQPPIALAS